MTEQVADRIRALVERVIADRRRIAGGNPKRLEHFGYKIYSQTDEDGILAEIFKRVGTTNRVFVEFGAEVGLENNSRLLLEQGWTGLWIEGNPDYAGALKWEYRDKIADGRLKFIEKYVDRDNINGLIGSADISGQIDLLSIDIDSNDYHVFEAISVINPRVVSIEHNQFYPPPSDWIMPYNTEYRWDSSTGIVDCGASLVALTRLGKAKGYELVGCSQYAPNCFFVRTDLLGPWYKRRFPKDRSPETLFNEFNLEMILNYPVGKDIWTSK